MKYLLIIICIMVLAVSGCTSHEGNPVNNSSFSSLNNSTTSVPSTTTSTGSSDHAEVSGKCYKVVDGDTIDVEGVGRVRFVGVNTPEKGQAGYQTAKDYVTRMCLGKTVGLDIDNTKNKDKYDRALAVVYVDGVNLNQELLKKGYAEVMYIPPSEFNPYSWL
ncbi:thermonuclease [Methanobacterium formicicum DSM 3637]|uniref:Thermonuclease n=1 Tax=Methanobacterium formicicum (strain DSM 3637 / PP1) TaxID=1204725 RepID=K2RU24_METFP|nr:thermonuclease [Methanobacterium formicicum DSM 3637]